MTAEPTLAELLDALIEASYRMKPIRRELRQTILDNYDRSADSVGRPKLEYEDAIIDSLGSYLTDQLNKHGIKVEWAGMRTAIQRECDRQLQATPAAPSGDEK